MKTWKQAKYARALSASAVLLGLADTTPATASAARSLMALPVVTAMAAALLLLTPIGAIVLGAVVLGERPSPLQLAGGALVLVASYLGTARR